MPLPGDEDGNDVQGSTWRWALLALAAGVFVVVVRCAWVADDAYITLRTVDNFVHGRGLTWNCSQRVQAYTHPLWMFLSCVPYAVLRDAYWSAMVSSLGVTAAFLVLFVLVHAKTPLAGTTALFLLATSKAFTDYSTSGLENPLTHLLLCIAVGLRLDGPPSKQGLFLMTLVSALGALNRLDTLLLFLPLLVDLAWRTRARIGWPRSLATIALGGLPLLAWELFSLLYYGSLVPNTAYAKLNTGVSLSSYCEQGLFYLAMSTFADPLTSLAIVGVLAWIFLRERRFLPEALAILLTLAYVIRIGGDFMVCRHLAAPLVVAALVLARLRLSRAVGGALLAVLAGSVLFLPLSPVRSGADYDGKFELWDWTPDFLRLQRGVTDERAFYASMGLLRVGIGREPRFKWIDEGRDYERAIEAGTAKIPAPRVTIGMFGYHAGPRAKVLDRMGLADPLLARLPIHDVEDWRIGHFGRGIPRGYRESLEEERNLIENPDLAAYYERLLTVVSGPLWRAERLRAIWELNTGRCDELIESYVERARGKRRR